MGNANRWLHLRHPQGFTTEQFESFKAQCRIWRRYVQAVFAEWQHFESHPAPTYEFFEPELSADRRVATLPIGGGQTLGTRADFEDSHARLLWERFGLAFKLELEEGLTEPSATNPETLVTNWRKALRPVGG